MRLLVACALLAVVSIQSHWVDDQLSSMITTQNDDLWGTIQRIRDFSIPNFSGCEHTQKCYQSLLTSIGFDSFPSYTDYVAKMSANYATGDALKQYCGTFDIISQCFSQESDSCRSPTALAVLFELSADDAYRFAADLDLRKIMCDNQQALQDPCLAKMKNLKVSNAADANCDVAASEFSALISQAADTGCPASVQSATCQVNTKTKQISTLGACDGKMPKCPTTFTSCDRMQQCFDTFYAGVEALGVKTPLPDYASYASQMTKKFENADGIDGMCRLQETLHACLVRHINKNCPLNAQSFRSMYNMNYEQAYDYSTDFMLRKQQCINKEGMKKNSCVKDAKHVLNICQPEIPHNLTLGRSCTDLRLAMRCNNFAVKQYCPDADAQKAYCVTTEIVYQQGALGFCDGWLPSCDSTDPTAPPVPASTASSLLDTIQTLQNLTIPNFSGCEQTRQCFSDLLTSVGLSVDAFPSYAVYQKRMSDNYEKGDALKQYCGTFTGLSHCFSQETDSCRTPTVFAELFDLSSEDAYQFTADLDLRKIMCDNQQALQDPCLKTAANPMESIDADATCTVASAGISGVISAAADNGCPDSVVSATCLVNSKKAEIGKLGACDGKMPKCTTNFHSCDRMNQCFDAFYNGVEKLGVKNPLPDYASYASQMTKKFENADGLDSMCRLQETLHACLVRHINKNCPLNAQSFRSMYNMNYEQAYAYSADFNLRKQQCINREGMKQNKCVSDAKHVLNICQPYIPHNLTLGRACTDLRLAMRCNNFVVRQYCPEDAAKAYCITTEIVYQQGALGFCDGWMPDCTAPEISTQSPISSSAAPPVSSATAPTSRTQVPPVTSGSSPAPPVTAATYSVPPPVTGTAETRRTEHPTDPVTIPTAPTKSPVTTPPVTTRQTVAPTTSGAGSTLSLLSAMYIVLRLVL